MIASTRGLLVMLAIAIACGVLAFAGGGPPPVEDHALVPGLGEVTELAWTPGVTVVATDHGRWRLGAGWADPGAIDRVRTALRGGRWQRRADEAKAGAIHATLRVNGTISIGLGEPLGDQAWVVIDHRALLVESWVARALDPTPLDLRNRRPLANAASATTIRIGTAPELDVQHGRLGTLRVDPLVVASVVQTLAEVTLVRLPDSPPAGEGTTVTLAFAPPDPPVELTLAGACGPELVAVRVGGDAACIAAGQAQAIGALAALLAGSPDELMDHRPAPGPVRVTLLDGTVVDTAKAPKVGADDADPDKATELLVALATPAALAPLPATPARGKLVVVDAAGATIELEVHGELLVEPGQPRAWRPTAANLAIATEPAAALRVARLWVEEPTAIASITVGATTYKRGAVIGEWSGGDPKALDALAAALARPRAEPGTPALVNPRHVAFTTAPPVGSPAHHDLEVALDGARCAAKVDGRPLYVDRVLCNSVTAIP